MQRLHAKNANNMRGNKSAYCQMWLNYFPAREMCIFDIKNTHRIDMRELRVIIL